MSDGDREGGDIERYTGKRPESSRGRASNEQDSPQTIADAVSGSLPRRTAVTVESDSARATLVGVPTLDVSQFVYSHQVDDAARHPVALFDVENTTDRPLKWKTSRTQFVGSDEYTYQPARLTLDPSRLGPGCHTRQVELPPGRRARVVTPVEALPAGVELVEVVHSLTARPGAGGPERLVFSL